MDFSQETVLTWFSQYAYDPTLVYTAIICLMTASSFGLPVPEEVTLVSTGLVAYMAGHPELFPPPEAGAIGVNPYTAAIVALIAVFTSDLLVFLIGRYFGPKVMRSNLFKRLGSKATDARVASWIRKYGAWACGIFRFTPGLRFPGHMACGMVGVPMWKFIAVDGTAALISVPTQVLLIALYGDTILAHFKKFKFAVLILLITMLSVILIRKWMLSRRTSTLA